MKTGALYIAAAAAGVVLAVLLVKKGTGAVTAAAGAVANGARSAANAINPGNPENIFASAANGITEALSGDPSFGGWLYSKLNAPSSTFQNGATVARTAATNNAAGIGISGGIAVADWLKPLDALTADDAYIGLTQRTFEFQNKPDAAYLNYSAAFPTPRRPVAINLADYEATNALDDWDAGLRH